MFGATIWHVRRIQSGQIKGFKYLGEMIFGRQMVTDRVRNPKRFRVFACLTSLIFVACWIGWFFIFRTALTEN